MAVEFNRKEQDVAKVTVDRRLWLNADGKLVEDGDPSAAFLWAVEGRQVPEEEAERRGYKPRAAKADPDHVCDVCGYEAKSAAGLAAHARSHEG